MKKFVLLLGSFAAVLTLSLTSCSKSVSRDDVVAEMKKQGIPDNMVDCVADAMIARFGSDKLGSNDTLTADEQAAAQKIGSDCATKALGVTTTAP